MIARRMFLASALAAPLVSARAQSWPNRPIKVVVPSVTGGFDVYARMMAPKISEILGQPFIIENKPGANGNIGMQEVQRSSPDGHTILFAAVGSLTINGSVYNNMPFDPVEELAAVACPVISPMVWNVFPGSGINSMADLVARAKADPGKMDYALPSAGTINHLIVEAFKMRHGLDIPAVPYRGTPPAQMDVMAGRVPVMVDSLGASWNHINDGRLRPIAVTSAERSPRAPSVPTVMELGLEDRPFVAWYGFLVPKMVDRGIVNALNSAVNNVVAAEDFKDRLRDLGATSQTMTPDQCLEFMRSERKKWGDIARSARIEVV